MQQKKNKPKDIQVQKNSNKIIFWILGGCLALLLLGGVFFGGIAYWSYKKVKKDIKENQRRFEQAQNQAQNSSPKTGASAITNQISIPEEPAAMEETYRGGVPDDIYPPAVSEKAIGFVKKAYAKGGKNYIEIDYIQWLTGDVAEKAMREDGECPKKGECIVLNVYYIRNQNPLIRTFEVASDAEILAHDFSSYDANANWNESWTFTRFSNYFNRSADNRYWDSVPFHVEIGNNQMLKITEQYIP